VDGLDSDKSIEAIRTTIQKLLPADGEIQVVEVLVYKSAAERPLATRRPLRVSDHTPSRVAPVGGGRPGSRRSETTLAHQATSSGAPWRPRP
jgi:predicted ATPase with chaperone activity